jgi:Imelysin
MRSALLTLALTLALVLTGCGGDGDDSAATAPTTTATTATTGADLGEVKEFLRDHTAQLESFTGRFQQLASDYSRLAENGVRPAERSEAASILGQLKRVWTEGNPYYERVEGIVAGTPSLSEFDVTIDAGSSAAEDPESAVPFDLTLPDGKVLEQPGNLFNLTEGALWGTLPEALAAEVGGAPADLNGDGRSSFGELLPHAGFLEASSGEFRRQAGALDRAAGAWQPTPSDAFTSLVVMVPTMSEYFGQWKESRFVRGSQFTSESFNVVSRLSDIRDILSGLEVIYRGIEPLATKADPAKSRQAKRELRELKAFVDDIYAQERSGRRYTPEQADSLGAEAQSRATAIAGQVSQLAGELSIPIEQ